MSLSLSFHRDQVIIIVVVLIIINVIIIIVVFVIIIINVIIVVNIIINVIVFVVLVVVTIVIMTASPQTQGTSAGGAGGRELLAHQQSLVSWTSGMGGVDEGEGPGDSVGGETGVISLGSSVGVVAATSLQSIILKIFQTMY